MAAQENEAIKIIVAAFGILVFIGGGFVWLIVRLVKGFDDDVKELYNRTSHIEAMKTDIVNIKEMCKERHNKR